MLHKCKKFFWTAHFLAMICNKIGAFRQTGQITFRTRRISVFEL
jgi:hypothetical protein